MFTAKDRDGSFVCSLAFSNDDRYLIREVSSNNRFYCPACEKSLIARLGKKRRWHFAHLAKDNNKCPLKSLSPEVTDAVVLVYEWLKNKDKVIEINPEYLVSNNGSVYNLGIFFRTKKRKYLITIISKQRSNEEMKLIDSLSGELIMNYLFLHGKVAKDNSEFKFNPTHRLCIEFCKKRNVFVCENNWTTSRELSMNTVDIESRCFYVLNRIRHSRKGNAIFDAEITSIPISNALIEPFSGIIEAS